MTRILGLSAYYHDSAAALVEDGRIVAAAQEERFTRRKGDASLPHRAIAFCLDAAGVSEEEIDHVVFYEEPFAKFERLLETYYVLSPSGLRSFLSSMPVWMTEKLWMEHLIAKEIGVRKRVQFCDHHLSHAASAFYPSPFERAAIVTVDGVGESSTTTVGIGEGNRIRLLEHVRFPNSLGLLYSAFTYYTGFKINSGEYKLMGLAPYGEPKYAGLIREKLIWLNVDGSIVLNQAYFDYAGGLRMTNGRFNALFGGPPREPESHITQKEMDIAASIQEVLNDAMLRLAAHAREKTGCEHLVLAGGVALNVVANGLISEKGPFRELWVQPGAGDAGGSIGAALWLWHEVLGNPRTPDPRDSMQGAFLGPDIPPASPEDDELLTRLGAVWESLDEDALASRIASEIAAGKVVAVARGRMEFGPRALGARSILADARDEGMQTRLNMKIKFRESFRPFAPMVLAEDAPDWFEMLQESPYMLLLSKVVERRRRPFERSGKFGFDLIRMPRSDVPAITHLDYSARVQTVDCHRNPFMWSVLSRFKERTGCPVIVNTSFNVRSEPIVCTVEDAYRCFMATDVDVLIAGNRVLERTRQKSRPLDEKEREAWLKRFERD